MDIEITTTKKKLSKSLINQMPRLLSKSIKLYILEKGHILGYVINCRKDSYKTAIIKYDDEYFVINLNYNFHDDSKVITRCIGKYSRSYSFKSTEQYETFKELYSKLLNKIEGNHIYL